MLKVSRLLPLLAILALAGCGVTAAPVRPTPAPAAACPPNQSFMGCATPAPKVGSKLGAAPAGGLLPDVSMWQPNVNWPAVKAWQRAHGWTPAAIFKLGEYTLDPQAARNAQQLHSLGMIAQAYWFVRATGCSHEAGLIIWAAKRYGIKVVWFDSEVPEARGYDACLAGPVRAAGLIIGEYTSPGSNPDSSNPGLPMWVAAFGPSHVPCVWTCSVGQSGQSILAFQFTDGTWGAVTDVPGIGRDDVNADYGITKLGVPRPPPPLRCFGKGSTPNAAKCKPIVALYAIHVRAVKHANIILARWHCTRPYGRPVCKGQGYRSSYYAGAAAKLLKTYS